MNAQNIKEALRIVHNTERSSTNSEGVTRLKATVIACKAIKLDADEKLVLCSALHLTEREREVVLYVEGKGGAVPCECGATGATWRGDTGRREYCCEACWTARSSVR